MSKRTPARKIKQAERTKKNQIKKYSGLIFSRPQDIHKGRWENKLKDLTKEKK